MANVWRRGLHPFSIPLRLTIIVVVVVVVVNVYVYFFDSQLAKFVLLSNCTRVERNTAR